VDSYDTSRIVAGWAKAELAGPNGIEPPAPATIEITAKGEKLPAVPAKVPSMLHFPIAGKGYTRFRAKAAIDDRCRQTDIMPAVRFFVFTEKPDPDQLIRIQGEPPSAPPRKSWTAAELADRLYAHLLARRPSAPERKTAVAVLGGAKVTADGAEDLLWALLMSPEFQYIH
jgi:hypothetical protein